MRQFQHQHDDDDNDENDDDDDDDVDDDDDDDDDDNDDDDDAGTNSYKASELKLKQKCGEISRLEDHNAEMKVRLELEHERRVRAGMEIGEIEKEKVILQKELESKNSESVKLSEECEEIKSNCEYKVSKYTAEIKKLEAKLERVQLEKDKKIFDLQDKNTELFLKLESSEDQIASQLEVATTLQNELQSSYAETQSLIKVREGFKNISSVT